MTASCALLAAHSALGEWADLADSGESRPVVPAAFIRQLLLGLPLRRAEHEAIAAARPEYAAHLPSGDAGPVPVAAAGVRLRRATVEGLLDLADCCGVGGMGLPALVLEDCELTGNSRSAAASADDDYLLCLDLSRSRIARLSLKDSCFGFLRAQEAVIEGSVDLSGVQPLAKWTDRELPEAADMAAFRAAMNAGRDWPQSTAEDTGDKTVPAAEALPGRACCWADLTGSRIGGEVIAIASRFRTPPARAENSYHFMDTRYGLKLTQATIGGSLIAFGRHVNDAGSIFDGGLNLHLACVRGEVWLGGVQLIKAEGSAMDAQASTLGGVFATGKALRSFGSIYFNAANIRRHLHFNGADLDGHRGSALQADGVTVGGDFLLQEWREAGTEPGQGEAFAAHGPVRLKGARIGGLLDMEGALLHGRGTEAFDGSFMRVGSDVNLARIRARGCIVLRNANVGDTLHLENSDLHRSVPEEHNKGRALDHMLSDAVSAEDTEVGVSVLLKGTAAAGSLCFERARADKDFVLVGASIDAPEAGAYDPDADAADAVNLGWANIGGTLHIESNHVDGVLRLTHATANILQDHESGYGDAERVELFLDGLRYQSLSRCDLSAGLRDGGEPASTSVGCAESRAAWLKRPKKHKPQPYAQLARVLAGQGQPEDAREILIRKQSEELRSRKETIREMDFFESLLPRASCLASRLFGGLFGFGLKPRRAIATILVAFAVGSAGTVIANARGAMIVEQQPIAGAVSEVGQVRQLGASESEGRVVDRLPCADNIDPVLYALDVFIPLVDLRQESKCEVGEAVGTHRRLLPGVGLSAAELWVYRVSKVLYAIAGWLIISLAILTFSGVLQRRAEQ